MLLFFPKQFGVHSAANVKCHFGERVYHFRFFLTLLLILFFKLVHSLPTVGELVINVYGLVIVIQLQVEWGKVLRIIF